MKNESEIMMNTKGKLILIGVLVVLFSCIYLSWQLNPLIPLFDKQQQSTPIKPLTDIASFLSFLEITPNNSVSLSSIEVAIDNQDTIVAIHQPISGIITLSNIPTHIQIDIGKKTDTTIERNDILANYGITSLKLDTTNYFYCLFNETGEYVINITATLKDAIVTKFITIIVK